MLISRVLMAEARVVRPYIAGAVMIKFAKLAASLVQVTVIAQLAGHAFAGTVHEVRVPATAGLVLGAGVLRVALTLAENWLACQGAARVKTGLRERLYRKLLELEMGYQLATPSSAVVSAAVDGIEALDVYFSRYLPQLFYSLLAPLLLFSTWRASMPPRPTPCYWRYR